MRDKIITKTIIACVSLFILPIAHAELTVSSYKSIQNRQQYELLQIYLSGVESGLGYANTKLIDAGKSPLFCAPDNLSLEPQNLLRILEKQISDIEKLKSSPKVSSTFRNFDAPLPLLLLDGLIETFPCKK